jgi:hypothetical protein
MRDSVLILCLLASGAVNFFLLWLCWQWYSLAKRLLGQLDETRKSDLIARGVA